MSSPPDGTGLPVVLHLAGRRCLVVGGGPVAARRAGRLLDAGAQVTVVAPVTADELDGLAARGLAIERRPYRPGEASGFDLAVTATGDPDVDAMVVADATAGGVLVSSADRGVPATFSFPAASRRGRITVAVATGGASPSLSRWLLRRVAGAVPDGVDELAGLLDEARAALRRVGRQTGEVDWDPLLDELARLVAVGRTDEARTVLLTACGLAPSD